MDSVMINQLPELAIPTNRTFTPVNKMTVASPIEKRNPYLTKWYVLFGEKNEQWISHQPQLGHVVYPCYACRNMFGNRNSFLDHVNRRGLILKYSCTICKKLTIFYNTCSFLLHAREHFTDKGGTIDLDNVNISTIPMNIVGFSPMPNISRLYETSDDTINLNLKLNVKFYKPNNVCASKRIINFIPNDLLFFTNLNANKSLPPMMLQQVNKFIPKCIFMSIIPLRSNLEIRQNFLSSEDETDICLDDDESLMQHTNNNMIVDKSAASASKIQIKNLNPLFHNNYTYVDKLLFSCPECDTTKILSILDHFQKMNKPLTDDFKCTTCGLILTTPCALKAHMRLHDKKAPFVCPECGAKFVNWDSLDNHMECICFHTAKAIRFKCPAKKCGKVFAQPLTFSSHFPGAHMKVRFACSECPEYFINEAYHKEHSELHEHTSGKILRIHECTVCSVTVKNIKEHVLHHVQDRDNRIFVFICKYCRSYYRSKLTYAGHILKCTKLLLNNQVKKEVQRSEFNNDIQYRVIKFCKSCSSKVQFNCIYKNIKYVATCCPMCSTPFSNNIIVKNKLDYCEYTSNAFVRKDVDNECFICVLCSEALETEDDDDFNYNNHLCKYKNPVIELNALSSSQCVSTVSVDNLDSPSSDDSGLSKRKRKRFANGTEWKNKRNSLEQLSVNPEPFDGEYKCKLCRFTDKSRTSFHTHIQQHRDVSTSYQCMECGECFVVKPSLLMHLQVFHLIENVDEYLNDNECFDREAVRELEQNMRMVPGEVKEPVAENQCRICRQMFSDAQELSKHFRVHGMAFLMKEIIK